ncbi:MAG: hypothetical protein RLZZ126_1722 [Pseudomonadota bacterium]|jgi:outer membrane assembly lipoprotein YfgL
MRGVFVVAAAVVLVACSSTSEAPKPAELPPNVALMGVRQAWVSNLGPVGFSLTPRAVGTAVLVAASDGTVASLDARTGQDHWRTRLAAGIAAGVGGDGKIASVVTQDNQLVALDGGREIWRQKLSATSYTPPLVAGGRVFVLTADRAVSAYDGATGRRLWQQTRPGEPLVLRQAGLLQAQGDTLVAGLSGRVVGMNPANGSSRWEVPVAVPRGTNDVERLVDLVGGTSRQEDSICVRSYQTMVACVNAARGSLAWSKASNGAQGVSGDDSQVYGTELDGKITAYRRQDRQLTAPLALGRSIAVGDSTGLVHLLSRADGSALNRLSTDGSGIAASPVLAGETLVVVTRNGSVFGFRPE